MDRWQLRENGILWDVANDTRLPHSDHIEMSGRKVSVIVRYTIDENRRLTLTREVIWPTLRTKEGDVRGYLKRTYGEEVIPQFSRDGESWKLPPVQSIALGPHVRIVYETVDSLTITRILTPCLDLPAVAEAWFLRGPSGESNRIMYQLNIPDPEAATGVYGDYRVAVNVVNPRNQASMDVLASELRPATPVNTFLLAFTALRENESYEPIKYIDSSAERSIFAHSAFVNAPRDDEGLNDCYLQTPDPVLDSAFAFAKLRAAESLFETKMGLVHSPGGGRYYGGVWNNDQCEYSGPLFGYLGDLDAELAALTAYRNFMPYMTPEYKSIPTSLEMEGTIPYHAGGDRGDAAMYAGGASRYALTRGDRVIAEELWPAIQWCLEFCCRKTNADGVVESDTDELENRFPAGDANLSTSCLAYDGYRRAADLARSLGKPDDATIYDERAEELAAAIERHFGATVEGFPTYRYYDGNSTLRSWICLPLVFGLADQTPERKAGTIAALFSPRLWTPDGLATEAGDKVFWDRSTLYALRGVFFAGETETALEYLTAYSRRRLLGDHVPYPVEAYPEGGQAHLSAESALYCRIFTEGLFGLVPTGLRSFTLTPRLPAAWPEMSLRRLHAFGHIFDVTITRDDDGLRVRLTEGNDTLAEAQGAIGETFAFTLM
jgi:hypothetical protein